MSKIKNGISRRKYAILLSWTIATLMLGILAVTMFNEIYVVRLPWARKAIVSPISNKKTSYLPKIEVAHAEAPSHNIASGPDQVSRLALQGPDLKSLVLSYFPANERDSVDNIISHESTWNQYAINPTSGACGLGQALPCSKMGCDTLDQIQCQALWIQAYGNSRYGNMNNAWAFWQANKYW